LDSLCWITIFFHPVREKFYSQRFHCQHAIARFVTLQAVFFLKAASSWFNYYGVSHMFFPWSLCVAEQAPIVLFLI
jgi:hypothetical protein